MLNLQVSQTCIGARLNNNTCWASAHIQNQTIACLPKSLFLFKVLSPNKRTGN